MNTEPTGTDVRNTGKEIPEAVVNTYRNTPEPLPLRAKIGHKLFPQKYVDLPKAPATWPDVLHSDTTIVIDWKDRIRILLTGRAVLRSKTITQNIIGDHIQGSEFSVLPWSFLQRNRKGR